MSKRILLADDSLTIQKVVELTFMDEDFEVEAVGSGDEAISRLAGDLPNILIADVHMPGASGYEVCRQAKAMSSNLPVLLLVGTFEALDENEMVACGADGNLKKPFDSQELLQVVKRMTSGEAPERAETSDADPIEGFERTSHDEEPQVEPPVTPVTGFDLGRDDAGLVPDSAESESAMPDFDSAVVELDGEPELAPVDLGLELGSAEHSERDARDGSDSDEDSGNETVLLDVLPESPSGEGAEQELAAQSAAESISELETQDEAVDAQEGEHDQAESAASVVSDAPDASSVSETSGLSDADVERVARRVVELMSADAVREVAWDVIPDMAEIVIKARVRELEAEAD